MNPTTSSQPDTATKNSIWIERLKEIKWNLLSMIFNTAVSIVLFIYKRDSGIYIAFGVTLIALSFLINFIVLYCCRKKKKTKEDNKLNTIESAKTILASIIDETDVVKSLMDLEKGKDEEAISLLRGIKTSYQERDRLLNNKYDLEIINNE